MKKFLLLLVVSIIMMINSGCTGNQKSQTEQSDTISVVRTDTISSIETNSLTEDEIIVQMLTEFYRALLKIKHLLFREIYCIFAYKNSDYVSIQI